MAKYVTTFGASDRHYRHASEFTTANETYLDMTSVDTTTEGISHDDTNTPWTGRDGFNGRMYLQSGQFTATIKNSYDFPATVPNDCSTYNIGSQHGLIADELGDDLWRIQGLWSSTTLQQFDFSATSTASTGICGLIDSVLVCDSVTDVVYRLSGFITSTQKASVDYTASQAGMRSVSWNGTDTLIAGQSPAEWQKYSGLLGTTELTQLDHSSLGTCFGLETDSAANRLAALPSGGVTTDGRLHRIEQGLVTGISAGMGGHIE